MADEIDRINDLLSAPMESVIVALGVGIARAQQELDRHSIETQRQINEDPLLSEYGLQATWYQMPRTELELTIAITMEDEEGGTQPSALPAGGLATGLQALPLKRLNFQPVNATYANQFSYDVQAASKVKLSIVPVPPPAADAAVTPKLNREEVVTTATPHLVTEEDGTTMPPDARLAVNFNGQARLWFVLQYRLEDDELHRLALVVVDDDTGAVVKHQTES